VGAVTGARGAPLLAFLVAVAATGVVSAAEASFGEATVTAKFGEAITVEQRVSLPSGVRRVEAYVREGSSSTTLLAEIANPGAGDHVLSYRRPTPEGSIFPNTRVELGFRLTLDDGQVIDSPPAKVLYEDDRYAWNTLEGELVRVHWYQGNDAFGHKALAVGEEGVADASELLGVTETEPIDFYIYADEAAFRSVLGPAIRENVGGLALPEIRTLFANIGPTHVNDSWIRVVIPHELTHLVFRTATSNPYHAPPHWLNEGLAVYLSEGYAAGARTSVERAARDGAIMPLRALVGQFPTAFDRFGLAYDESVSAIDYLIRTHGQEALVGLIRSYSDGVTDDEAFSAALDVDVAGFETGWLSDLGIEEPAPYGPLPAPPGPLPPGWAAAPVSTGQPGSSGAPAATFRTARPGEGDDVAGPIAIGVILVLAVLLVVGLFVVAQRLGRGEPLLASPTDRDGGEARGDGGDGDDGDDGDDAVDQADDVDP
jgi:hypothetical protein